MTKLKKSSQGFTLLELLVVFSIIAILIALVYAGISSAKNKSSDGAIKGELAALRVQASLYAANNNDSYNNLFVGNSGNWTPPPGAWTSADPKVNTILTSIKKRTTVYTAGSTALAWAAQARSVSDPTKYLCVDLLAPVRVVTTALSAGATVCPSI